MVLLIQSTNGTRKKDYNQSSNLLKHNIRKLILPYSNHTFSFSAVLENLARNKILEEDKVKLIARDRREREKYIREVASEYLTLIYTCIMYIVEERIPTTKHTPEIYN